MSQRLRLPYRFCLAKLPSWRQAFFLLVGAAFLLQSYVTQTHIHPFAQLAATAADRLASANSDIAAKADKPNHHAPSRDRLPADDDPAKCPLCQAMATAGNYVWPHAAIFILPQLPAATVPVVATILRIPAPQSHDWRGRAPPRL